MGRFPQEKFNSRTGAIRLEATPPCYPIMVQVRPSGGATQRTPTGLRNFGPMAYATARPETSGDVIDFVLRGPHDKQEPGSNDYWQTRGGARAILKAIEVNASSSPDTDIYDRIFCAKDCGSIVREVGQICNKCSPQADPLCTAMRRTDSGPAEC